MKWTAFFLILLVIFWYYGSPSLHEGKGKKYTIQTFCQEFNIPIPEFDVHKTIKEIIKVLKKKLESFSNTSSGTDSNILVAIPDENMVILFLKNGGAISGELIYEDADRYRIRAQGGVAEFMAYEVKHVQRGKTIKSKDNIFINDIEGILDNQWNFINDIVIVLTNGEILDVPISSIRNETITVRYDFDEGGSIEQDILRSKVEYLMFKPILNQRSREIENSLKNLFPDMKFYNEGSTTIVTDSYITWVRNYKRILRQVQTEIYCKFYNIFKTREQHVQNYVVIFDHPEKYIENAVSDGVPGWIVPGYFSPTTKVLYLYNMIGEEMENFINGLMHDVFGKAVDDVVDRVETFVDKRYHVFVEGQAKSIKDKYWRYFEWYMGRLRRTTFAILRHEFSHELFSNWALVGVVISKIKEKEIPNVKKKKKFLETKDVKEKQKILRELITLRSEEPLPEIQAANSWLAEGLATYCETGPTIGSQNDERVYCFQEMLRDNAFFPLEQLTVYKIGSFPGMYHEAMLYAYSQSWALVKYFMDTYPDKFMKYILKISEKTPEGNEDIEWLIEAIGKDARTIEAELLEYMKKFPQIEDPYFEQFDEMQKLHDSLVNFGSVNA